MAGHGEVDWATCAEDGCIGVPLPTGGSCWAHAADRELSAALQQVGKHGRLDARGVPVTAELLERILSVAPRNADGHAVIVEPRFRRASFHGDAQFAGATFEGIARFDAATFHGSAQFDAATFHGSARFTGATFQRNARFDGTTWTGDAMFDGAKFQRTVGFPGATFQGGVGFGAATFHDTARFTEATFQRNAGFDDAAFDSNAGFTGATFRGNAGFDRATIQGNAGFTDVRFENIARFVGATFRSNAGFDRATFMETAWFTSATFAGTAGYARTTFRGNAGFDRATFHHNAGFDRAIFMETAWFTSATFAGTAGFTRATFHSNAGFDRATFQGTTRFRGATFMDTAWFPGTTFASAARFRGATFQATARFTGATFVDTPEFRRTAFQAATWFDEAIFHRDAGFSRASFQGDASFDRATVHGSVWFDGATFHRARRLGPILARRSLILDDTVFQERVLIEVSAAAVGCRRARFLAGVQLRVRWAQVVLDDADMAAPSILSGGVPFPGLVEGRWANAVQRLQGTDKGGGRPRLVSMRRADVAGLTVAGADLRACRFVGAHHLDQLRLDEADFASTPDHGPWTTRQTLAEEHHWRALQGHRGRPTRSTADQAGSVSTWYGRAQQPPAWLDAEPISPGQIAALYRSLRKGREDNNDEPGAADFYYGEMEMRRHDATKPKAERLVLFLYWLFSGYALRASRTLAWLLVVLVIAIVLLAGVGLQRPGTTTDGSFPARVGTAALVALEGAVFRTTEQDLTYIGRLIQAVLRFAGPILLGLTALSIRGRVKR